MVRVKRRYILARIKENQSRDSFVGEFKNIFQQLYGDYGIACLNRTFHVKHRPRYVIVCVRKGLHEMAMGGMALLPGCNIIHLSGTMNKCIEKFRIEDIMNTRKAIGQQAC